MSSPSPAPTSYPEITRQARCLANEREDAPTLPKIPPLPMPATKDREGWLVRVCVVLICLFFVVIFVGAFTCHRR